MQSSSPHLPSSFAIPGQEENRSRQLFTPGGKTIMNSGDSLGIPSPSGIASPAGASFASNRSPLQILGDHSNSLGMRQRKGGNKESNWEASSPPPPKASMSMGMMNVSPKATKPKAVSDSDKFTTGIRAKSAEDENWGLVYGFTNDEQKTATLDFMKSFGKIRDTRKLPDGNWIAVNWEARLGRDKAKCHFPHQLDSGGFIGLLELNSIDRFLEKQRKRHSSLTGRSLFPSSASTTDSPHPETTTKMYGKSEVSETDIFVSNRARDNTESRSVCESIMAWIYGW